ncbi:ImuA family protein [Salipiger sp. PrR002]|nr:hypothetical protein [Salipiger sp. PrR002]
MRPLPASAPLAEADPLALCPARVHEAEGRARRGFALFQASRHAGPLIWITPQHAPQLPLLRGLPEGIGARLHLVRTHSEADLLWAAEEALRCTAVGLVVAEPGEVLSLKAGRRLQLAAEAGQTTGLMLIQSGQGSNAAETRWACEQLPAPAADSTLHGWELIKNKKGTLRLWTVDWHGETAAFHLVSAAGQRHQPAQTAR